MPVACTGRWALCEAGKLYDQGDSGFAFGSQGRVEAGAFTGWKFFLYALNTNCDGSSAFDARGVVGRLYFHHYDWVGHVLAYKGMVEEVV
jgi:hypothetical protein